MRPIVCSFCGKSSDEVARIITGPSVYICCECLDTCTKILSGDSVLDWAITTSRAVTCSFCRRRPPEVGYIIVNSSSTICEGCVRLPGRYYARRRLAL